MNNKLNFKDIRDIFFNNIKETFLSDINCYILTNDADVFALKSLRKNKRFIDAGVAEQNTINIASGLTKKKKNVIIYGFCNFLTMRAYEQIKFNIGSMNMPVKIIGVGPGFSFSYDGPTHHAIQDIGLMNLIPEMEIFNISDNNLSNQISKKLFTIKGPVYIRLEKGTLSHNSNISYNLTKGFSLNLVAKKKNLLIITTGYFTKYSLELAKMYKNVSVLNFFRFKNFDKKSLIKEIKKYSNILVYDENTFYGGISSIILKFINDQKVEKKINFLTCQEKSQIFTYFTSREKLLDKLSLGKKNLKKKIDKILSR